MIIEIMAIVMASYLFVGLLLWVIPHDMGRYAACGFEYYNILFIFFWALMLLDEDGFKFVDIKR